MNTPDSFFFGGFRIEDLIEHRDRLRVTTCDVAIIVVGWESRSSQLLEHDLISGKTCILVSFNDDGIDEATRDTFMKSACKSFEVVEPFSLSSPLNAEQVMTDTESLAEKVRKLQPSVCAVDYSSMPRVVTQTLFRQFMIEGICPRVHWFYSSGLYDKTAIVTDDFNQGARDFFSIRGAEGSGGISSQRVAVLALGADRTLISSFMRQGSYDLWNFLDAASSHSPKLAERIKGQRIWLQSEHGIGISDFRECDAKSVVGTLRLMDQILQDFPPDEGIAVDVFCSGPKSQAIAASALVSVYGNVRLVGRIPVQYLKVDIRPTKEISITTVTDFTNPLLVRALIP